MGGLGLIEHDTLPRVIVHDQKLSGGQQQGDKQGGIAYGIPAPGTTMGVSDEVEVRLELEFSGPPLVSKPAP